MRAALYYKAKDLRIEDIAEPDGELGPNEVLVRNKACGICGTDLHEYLDGPIYSPQDPHPVTQIQLPVIPGHEFAGLVEAVGQHVTSVVPGDRVSIMPQIYCGTCAQCLIGRQQTCLNLAAVGFSAPWGGLAELGVFKDYQVFPIPDSMSYIEGALIEPTAVALHAVNKANIQPGDTVLVSGGGPIGQLAAMAAVAFGAGQVVLSEPKGRRRSRAGALGLTRVEDPVTEDLKAVVGDLTGGNGADVSIECSGGQAALTDCLNNVRIGGTVVQTALGTKPVQIDTSTQLTLRDVTYKGAYCYPVTSWPRVIQLVASGKIPASKIVTETLDIGDLTKGFDALSDPAGDQLKVIIEL